MERKSRARYDGHAEQSPITAGQLLKWLHVERSIVDIGQLFNCCINLNGHATGNGDVEIQASAATKATLKPVAALEAQYYTGDSREHNSSNKTFVSTDPVELGIPAGLISFFVVKDGSWVISLLLLLRLFMPTVRRG